MSKIEVVIKSKPKKYEIFIGENILDNLPKYITKHHQGKKIVIIIDEFIKKSYHNNISFLFDNLTPLIIPVKSEEESKSRENKSYIEDIMLKNKFGRDSLIVAIGGGIVTDLAGFIASTYSRGIPIINVPTTLLAMADASIGGKTSVNTRFGKNLIGSIYQPDAVFSDLDFIKTLPNDEYISGIAEIVKIATAYDKEFFLFLEKNWKNILGKKSSVLEKTITRSIELKKRIVESDENESGLRQIVNFGHTFAHALEIYSNFTIKHGFCVSLGIAVESTISLLIGELKKNDEKRIIELLTNFGFPIKLERNINPDKLIQYMSLDKKSVSQKPHFVILQGIGKVLTKNKKYSFPVENYVIKKSILDSKKK